MVASCYKGIDVNLILPSLQGGSLQFTLTVPLTNLEALKEVLCSEEDETT